MKVKCGVKKWSVQFFILCVHAHAEAFKPAKAYVGMKILRSRDGSRYDFLDTSPIIDFAHRSSSLLIPLSIPVDFLRGNIGQHWFLAPYHKFY